VWELDNALEEKYVCDYSVGSSWCADQVGFDWVRAQYVATHGSSSVGASPAMFWLYMKMTNNTTSNSCDADFHKWQLGDTNEDFLTMFACFSSNVDDQLQTWGGWASRAAGIHIGNGLHGEGWGFGIFETATYDFAIEGLSTSIVSGWRDHLTAFKPNGITYDQCAVPWVIGTNSTDAWSRWNEQYDEGRADPVPPGYLGYWYVCNCCADNWGTPACTPSC
jgi:hypothetical protein